MIYIGICDAAGYTAVALSYEKSTAEQQLFSKWRAWVGAEFQPSIDSFAKLKEWNGAQVSFVPLDHGVIWEQTS